MRITKYNQSCLLVETEKKRILIDPGRIGLTDEMINNNWTNIDVILVTHKHFDHCDVDAINSIIKRDNSKLYTSREVVNTYSLTNPNVVKENDVFDLENITIEVTKAVHGFLTPMKENNGEVKENIGFIIDDKKTRLYTTSDTINFNNEYKCDVLCMPFNGNGLTMGIIDGIGFVKGINPGLLLPVHMQHPNPIMNPDINNLKRELERENIHYKILRVEESIEI